jgi:hypothetical protein
MSERDQTTINGPLPWYFPVHATPAPPAAETRVPTAPTGDDYTGSTTYDELKVAFLPAGPAPDAERSSAGPRIIAAAEAFAGAYREDPRSQQRWAEAAPARVRSHFLAIRDNTPGARPRDAVNPVPYHHDPDIPTLSDLSADLQDLLASAWPVWDRGC